MKKRKVIPRKNIPVHWPISMTAIAYLLLDKFKAPEWVWGIGGTLAVITWILAGISIFTAEETEIFEEKE